MVSDLTLDWSLISPSSYIDQTGQQTWPLTNLIFVYVFCDLTPFMYAGPLVKAMFRWGAEWAASVSSVAGVMVRDVFVHHPGPNNHHHAITPACEHDQCIYTSTR